MSEKKCTVCGSLEKYNYFLSSVCNNNAELLEKLYDIARIKIEPTRSDVICHKCINKIYDTHDWLHSILKHHNNKQRQYENVNIKKLRCKTHINRTETVKETILNEDIWKEDLTFNISLIGDEDNDVHIESIPNAQVYVSEASKVEESKSEDDGGNIFNARESLIRKGTQYNNSDHKYKDASPSFSFLTPNKRSNTCNRNEENYEYTAINSAIPSQTRLYDKIRESDSRRFKPSRNNLDDKHDSFSVFRKVNFTGWNLSKTNVPEKQPRYSAIVEDRNEYYASRQREIQKQNAARFQKEKKPSKPMNTLLQKRKSADIFASQDSNNDILSSDWQLTPDEDMITRARARINTNRHNMY